jgi:hypothetical protein
MRSMRHHRASLRLAGNPPVISTTPPRDAIVLPVAKRSG